MLAILRRPQGGVRLQFFIHPSVCIPRIESLKQTGEIVGNRTRVKVVKNKIAPPFKEAEFDQMFLQGISREGDVLDLASNIGVIVKSGAWYSYNDATIGRGRENTKAYLRENPQILDEVENKVRAYFGLAQSDEGTSSDHSDRVYNKDKGKGLYRRGLCLCPFKDRY